jgi:hypothetical protein
VRFPKKVRPHTLCRTSVFASSRFCGSCSAFGAFGAPNDEALFFILRWARCSFHKKCLGTRYAELLFLYTVGSVGHVVHSGAYGR